MTAKQINPLVSKLAALPFFPTDDDARIAIAEIFASCVATPEQVHWTVARCLALWDKWEGPRELRAVICSRYKPRDGVEATSRLPQFADGIPSENEYTNLRIEGRAPALQLSGDVEDSIFPRTANDLIREVTRPRDAVDEITERTEREKKLKRAPIVAPDEIDRILSEQEAARNPKAAEELARQLGILK